MHTRPATPADFPSIADIAVACFETDALYLYTNPGLRQYPLCFRQFFLLRTHARFWTPGNRFEVAVTDAEKEGDGMEGAEGKGGKIIGYSWWIREGNDAGAKSLMSRDTMWARMERGLRWLQAAYIELLSLDRSLNRENLDTYLATIDETYPTGDLWILQNLCVDPQWQRRGIGGLLMQWGKNKAREEGVPVGLTASPMGEGLYKREGFREVYRVDGSEAGIVPVMMWEPEEMRGRWLKEEAQDDEGRREDSGEGGASQDVPDGEAGDSAAVQALLDTVEVRHANKESRDRVGISPLQKNNRIVTSMHNLPPFLDSEICDRSDLSLPLSRAIERGDEPPPYTAPEDSKQNMFPKAGRSDEAETKMSRLERRWMLIEELERRGQI